MWVPKEGDGALWRVQDCKGHECAEGELLRAQPKCSV